MFYIEGSADKFTIYNDNIKIGDCFFKNKNTYPFVISNNNFYLGIEGETHASVICNAIGMNSDEYDKLVDDAIKSNDYEEAKRLGNLWKKALQLINGNGNSVDGRIFLTIKKDVKSNISFDYAVLSFWGGMDGEDQTLNGNVVNRILKKFNVSPNKVLVAVFDYDNWGEGKLIPYKEWDFYVPEMDEAQKDAYAIHLMNASKKHDATSDFRAARDRKIGKKLTNDKGDEMTVAQYRNMIYSESKIRKIVKNVLKEYLYKKTKRVIF